MFRTTVRGEISDYSDAGTDFVAPEPLVDEFRVYFAGRELVSRR